MRRFVDRIALVTGAAGTIGAAIGDRLSTEGGTVIRADRVAAGPDAIVLDVTDEKAWDDAAVHCSTCFGRLDVLIHCAGVLRGGMIEETTTEDWQAQFAVNVTGAFLGSRAMLPLLRRGQGANVVSVASVVGLRGNSGMVAYSASKGGLIAMTYAMALDHAAEGLRFNCVCPGTIEGAMVEMLFADRPDREAARAASIARHPMARYGRAEEVAAAVAFLASDEASYITGIALPVDGGRSIR